MQQRGDGGMREEDCADVFFFFFFFSSVYDKQVRKATRGVDNAATRTGCGVGCVVWSTSRAREANEGRGRRSKGKRTKVGLGGPIGVVWGGECYLAMQA